MPRRTLICLFTAAACTPSQEPVRVALDVELDASGLAPGSNDAGWTVELTTARIAARDLQFTILGEMHAETASLGGWLLARAWAHPGHYAGGDVTGELVGEFILDWTGQDGVKLGVADLLVGDYNGLNFGFRGATVADGLAAADPLLGHTAQLGGTAKKGELTVTFTALLDVDEGAQMVGAPFEESIDEGSDEPIGLRFLPTDPVDGGSLFDGLDFAALDGDGDGAVEILPGQEAHNLLRRALQTHVHYYATRED